MKSPVKTISELGAVTFLDVLGWKGIWQKEDNAHRALYDLIDETQEKATSVSTMYSNTEIVRGASSGEIKRGKKCKTDVLSISDTITLFTEGTPRNALAIHSHICSWLLERALSQGIPLRGAISYGRYIVEGNIMIGYAVDEAASWHEETNWIGVILTPTAQIMIKDNVESPIIEYDRIPFKRTERNLKLCVNWHFEDREKLNEIILAKGPLTPEIAPKYLNTIEFLNRDRI
ncbi:MAG: hypothetical protein FWH55_14960 [Oscillospiraceae bacterium]|nr:hypothetical protein [Oscillospiraceae bacterium]